MYIFVISHQWKAGSNISLWYQTTRSKYIPLNHYNSSIPPWLTPILLPHPTVTTLRQQRTNPLLWRKPTFILLSPLPTSKTSYHSRWIMTSISISFGPLYSPCKHVFTTCLITSYHLLTSKLVLKQPPSKPTIPTFGIV